MERVVERADGGVTGTGKGRKGGESIVNLQDVRLVSG